MAFNTISAYIPDSLAADLQDKLKLLQKLKVSNLELTYREVPLEKLSVSEVYEIRDLLIDEGCTVSLYETDLKPSDRTTLNKLLRNALLLEIPSIKLDLAEGSEDDITFCLDAVDSYGIIPLIENSADSVFRDSAHLQDFIKKHQSRGCKMIFNPLEFVKTGRHPFFHIYYSSRLKNHIMVLRIIDGLYTDGSKVLPGHGNGEIKELISIMKARSFNGYYSVSPYIPDAGGHFLEETIAWLRHVLKNI